MIGGVTVIGDVLRPDGSGTPGGADRPTAWLFHAVRRQVGLACGLAVSELTTRQLPDLVAALTAVRPRQHAALHWAAGFAQEAEPALFTRHVLPTLRDSFCVGYELPPFLTAVLDREGIPYLDVRIHPVRFLDDLLFAVRSPQPETQAALSGLAVAEAEVIATAGLREAMCRLVTESTLPHDTLLVLGQRPMDSSQIVDGQFFDAMAHHDRIAALCARHRAVLLKPHPQEREHSLLVTAAGAARNVVGATHDNLYRLLSMPQVTAVLTVNSSAAHEAPYFGQYVYRLAPLTVSLAWAGDAVRPDDHVSIGDQVLTPDFWRMVLAPHTRVTPPDGMRLSPKPNRLRIALDSFWNFQEIDTDRVPGRVR
jgi:hypothetical protein